MSLSIHQAGFDLGLVRDALLPLARASYLPYLHPDGNYVTPEHWEVIGVIQPNNFGIVFQDASHNIVVAFRGTQNLKEWLKDFDALVVANKYAPGGVHAGIQRIYTSVRVSVAHLIQVALGKGRGIIYFIGHSLGGALAVIAADDNMGLEPYVVTFEAPRVLWFNGAEYFKLHCQNAYQIENIQDGVPHLPHTLAGYRNWGTQVLIDSGFTDSREVAHSLDSVEIGLGLYRPIIPALVTDVTS